MNNADKNVKMYACRNATNNSNKLNRVELTTLIELTSSQWLMLYCAATTTSPRMPSNTKWPATMLASRRTLKIACLMHNPRTSIAKIGSFSHTNHQGKSM